MASIVVNRMTSGVYPIAATPFTTSGDLDVDSIRRMVDYYSTIGVDGLTILGQMGEAPKLDESESAEIIKQVTSRTDVPVIVGVSAPGFAAMRSLSRHAMDLGAAGVMIAPPNTLRTDDQIVQYYAGAVEAIGDTTPFVLQDYPLTFMVVMTPHVILRIANNHSNCVMLKHEDWPGLEKISTLRRMEAEGAGPRLSILCGNGGLFLDFEMERGADGAMTGYCFPEMLQRVVSLATAGHRDDAHAVFDAHLPLLRYEQQPHIGLAVRKYVLARRGIISTAVQRRPGGELGAQARLEVDYLLDRVRRADPAADASFDQSRRKVG